MCSSNCRSGYRKEYTEPTVTFHAFPVHDKELLQTWLKRLARKDFTPSKCTKFCSLHFTTEDFMDESIDHNSTRKRKRNSKKLLRRRLKTGAVPSVFNNLPLYYTYQSEPHRSGLSTTSSRHERAAARLEERCENFGSF